ncbi:uncharacterized protein K460DRAFT_66994 [Cucurbitaria berberidis CBS 394.84]|uniref:Uncharacterized protein n=1 Tax=Cucurbitaria berberidis CBS 394.84 TaxID=1168544 RepID=A0A9P4GLY5_9PLEO|nr:uncharacterized protein K460DRAFT_66994 [Cucurbitaria berberidis CBS 394.84]KAF1848010.1 hypothetical protein K460DRAFT_66994 [Cucurbitaria berberidis CBS 394.84]
MSPPFIIQINEIVRNTRVDCRYDNHGRWKPSINGAAHVLVPGGVTGRLWYCDRSRIYEIAERPTGSKEYSTFSVYYVGGHGFWVLDGDATDPPDDDDWHPLKFDHSPTDYSSFLTNAGANDTLRCQRADQTWPQMLLPDIYRTAASTTSPGYGGLTGELPIFIALMAHTTSRQYLPSVIPHMFNNQAWLEHAHQYQRTEQRGVVVTVYTCPVSWAGGSTFDDLAGYERGDLGKYFN